MRGLEGYTRLKLSRLLSSSDEEIEEGTKLILAQPITE